MPSKGYTVSATAIAVALILLSRNLAAANASWWLLGGAILAIANNFAPVSNMLANALPRGFYYQNEMLRGLLTLAGLYALGKYAKAFQHTGKLIGLLEKIPGATRFANLDKPYALGIILLGLVLNAAIANTEKYMVSVTYPSGSYSPVKGPGSFTEFARATGQYLLAQLDLEKLLR